MTWGASWASSGETVNAILQEWCEPHLLEMDRRSVRLHDPERLRWISAQPADRREASRLTARIELANPAHEPATEANGARWPSRSSKPACSLLCGEAGFDSQALPPILCWSDVTTRFRSVPAARTAMQQRPRESRRSAQGDISFVEGLAALHHSDEDQPASVSVAGTHTSLVCASPRGV